MARITIMYPGNSDERTLEDFNTLGRHPDNNIQILDQIVSKEHCRLRREERSWVLQDLGSLNGTYVNGNRVTEVRLSHGDEILLGSTKLRFDSEDASESLAGTSLPGVPPVKVDTSKVDSHIRKRIEMASSGKFLPESEIQDENVLRQDYERLRVSQELGNAIGGVLDPSTLLEKILDTAFQLLNADRGVILMYDGSRELRTHCVRSRVGSPSNVTISNTILQEVIQNRAAVLSSDASVDARFQSAKSVIMQGIRSSMAVPLIYGAELLGVMLLDSQVATNAFTDKDLEIFQNIGHQAAVAIQNSLLAKKLEQEAIARESFRRLLSPAIAERVISGELEVKKGGELRETAVLFADIRGFTAMSESRGAQEIVQMLNEYFELMVEVIFGHEGTLDKFVGDEIMALFGAPVSHGDDARRALRAALEMISALKDFNREREEKGNVRLEIGIGINSGEVVAGYLGSSKALEYTVIGDAVNVGARLCSMAKPGEILVSASMYESVESFFEAELLPPVSAKGKSERLSVYRLLRERVTDQ